MMNRFELEKNINNLWEQWEVLAKAQSSLGEHPFEIKGMDAIETIKSEIMKEIHRLNVSFEPFKA